MDTLEIKKRQKSPHIVIASFAELFQDGVDTGGNRRRDAISGEEISDKEDFYLDVDDESRTKGYEFRPAGSIMPENRGVLKITTYQQIILGRQLRDLDTWSFTTVKPTKKPDHEDPEYYDPCDLGVYHFLKADKTPDEATVLAINRMTFLPSSPKPQIIYGFAFYGGSQAPTLPGTDKVLEFSLMTVKDGANLAKSSEMIENESSLGYFRRLGVLRMDVDNLGAIFRDGVGRQSTFAFYSALSRSLDWFFKGYLNSIWKNEGFDKRSQIIYSGGDDLFIVGRWDLMIQFAKKIAEDFGRYNGQNPNLGISGGVAVVTHKFPVIKASALAGTAEKKAKKHRHKAGKVGLKNAFTIMGEPLHWQGNGSGNALNCEYDLVLHLKDEIKNLGASNAQLGRGFCQRIQSYYAIKEAVSKQPKGAYDRSGDKYRWKWLIAYDFVRLKERLKIREHSKEAKFLDELQQSTFTGQYKQNPVSTQYEFIDLLNLAARWAELEYRSQD
jgi:CRISPR-associated protein Csm1